MCTPVTPSEFCTVTAVTATQPCTPQAAKVRRSAATPAPPPESVPAMVITRGGVCPTVCSGIDPPSLRVHVDPIMVAHRQARTRRVVLEWRS